jgi:hypothetical protein
MRVNQITDIKLYQKAALYAKLFSKAAKDAQAENRQKGIPNVYSLNGKFFYELPNGDIVTELPDELKINTIH